MTENKTMLVTQEETPRLFPAHENKLFNTEKVKFIDQNNEKKCLVPGDFLQANSPRSGNDNELPINGSFILHERLGAAHFVHLFPRLFDVTWHLIQYMVCAFSKIDVYLITCGSAGPLLPLNITVGKIPFKYIAEMNVAACRKLYFSTFTSETG